MRRLLVTAVCCVTVLLGAGCADSDAGRSYATTDATASNEAKVEKGINEATALTRD